MKYSQYYQEVASVILSIDKAVISGEMPLLSTLAQESKISEDSLQRAFSALVGISPKRYWQLRLLDTSKQKIDQSDSNIDLTYELGLSSTSRLNDLFINVVAMTPAEFRSKGNGLILNFGRSETPFGEAEILWSERGISAMNFVTEQESVVDYWRQQFNLAKFQDNDLKAQQLLAQIFGNQQPKEPLFLWVKGSNFQINVWQALINIPEGVTTNYQAIAKQIKNDKAVRAVGSAIAANPVAYIIPCHRVIRSDGGLGGYRWGLERKQIMLAKEAVRDFS